MFYSHNFHVVLWLQRDLQHFSPVDQPLQAGCGDGLPGDAVDLVEGVRFQKPLISRADEDLQPQWRRALVTTELVRAKKVVIMYVSCSSESIHAF